MERTTTTTLARPPKASATATDRDDAHTESAEYRQNQILQLEAFLDEELPVDEAGTDFADHVIVAGGLNDTFAGIHGSSDTLQPVEAGPAWTVATEDTLEYTQVSHESKIDHMLLSDAIIGRQGERGQQDGCRSPVDRPSFQHGVDWAASELDICGYIFSYRQTATRWPGTRNIEPRQLRRSCRGAGASSHRMRLQQQSLSENSKGSEPNSGQCDSPSVAE